ncbi:hypothetical protein I317_03163 [Kwoniella heveanensis CBS 569]|nr:hypothetical protein I317_03163 [Kwoniella heveanensis CBS 569]
MSDERALEGHILVLAGTLLHTLFGSRKPGRGRATQKYLRRPVVDLAKGAFVTNGGSNELGDDAKGWRNKTNQVPVPTIGRFQKSAFLPNPQLFHRTVPTDYFEPQPSAQAALPDLMWRGKDGKPLLLIEVKRDAAMELQDFKHLEKWLRGSRAAETFLVLMRAPSTAAATKYEIVGTKDLDEHLLKIVVQVSPYSIASALFLGASTHCCVFMIKIFSEMCACQTRALLLTTGRDSMFFEFCGQDFRVSDIIRHDAPGDAQYLAFLATLAGLLLYVTQSIYDRTVCLSYTQTP